MKKVKIQVNWLKDVPSGQPLCSKIPYRPIIVFENQYVGDWKEKPIYSTEIFNIKVDKKKRISIATLEIKSGTLDEYLKKGIKFELFETLLKVADGVVIEE